MTRKKSAILWIAIAVILLMTMYPPVLRTITDTNGDISSYRQIVDYQFYFTSSPINIHIQRLLIEWFIVILLTGGLMITVD